MEEQIKAIMADVLDLETAAIDDATAMDSVDTWDSYNHLTICLALEQEFSVTLEVEEMEEMISYYDMLRILQEKI
ncbi:MAG: acyl carrier protein [Magnetococcales bacterium]|nr:acyl carrier protein [Magnetococcales bacterium]